MKITFIRPNLSKRRSPDALQPLAIAVLKGLTPDSIETEFFDERIEEIPENIECDLAAISVQTFTARRAYQIADSLRKRGIKVVLGGYHATFMPGESLEHADAVVVGEAENIWEKVLLEAKAGKLAGIYKSNGSHNLKNVYYDRSIFKGKKYPNPVYPVEFSRGCKFSCEFCSVSEFNSHSYRSRPVSDVIEEIKALPGKYLLIVDDNIFADEENAHLFFKAMIPLKRKWGCQVSLDVVQNEENVALMAKSGCIAALIGFESLNEKNLTQMRKGAARVSNNYSEAIARIKRYGIMVYGSFLFGYDDDIGDAFAATIDFATKHKFFLANFNSINPMPGTKLYKRLKTEGRLINESWWLHEKYKYGEIMFKPKHLTPTELKDGCIWVRLRFSRYSQILRRFFDLSSNCRNISNSIMFIIGNIVSRREIHKKMRSIT